MGTDRNSGSLEDGQRIGRFVVLRDLGGQVHAVSAGSVGAVCETDDGSLLLLPGGRLIHVGQSLATVLAWLDGHGPMGGKALRPPQVEHTRSACMAACLSSHSRQDDQHIRPKVKAISGLNVRSGQSKRRSAR